MTEKFSETSDTEGLTAPCDQPIIPIFPLRFALKADTLLNMVRQRETPTTPTSIDAMPDHELLRIRRGYLYTFDGEDFQVFLFETKPEDENGAIYNPNIRITSLPAYRFQKYEWTQGAESEWQPIGEYYPYAFVPKDTPEAWVAYSESAWPYPMIFEAERSAEFRDRMMTRINLASRSGPYCAPITELEARVPAFRKDSVEYEQQDYSVANAIRMTATEIEAPSAVVTLQSTAETGVMVALPDPIGEMQDILGLLSVHVMTLNNFSAQHQYPLMIGKAVKNYADAGKVSTSSFRFFDGPLSTEFAETYASLLAEMATLEDQMTRLVWHWAHKLGEDGFGMLKEQLDCCELLMRRYSLEKNPLYHSAACAYAFWLIARTKPADAAYAFLSEVAGHLFGAISFDMTSADKLPAVAEKFGTFCSYSSQILSAGVEIHGSFKPALNAAMTVYATEIVQASTGIAINSTSRLISVMYRRETVRGNADDIKRAFEEMLKGEGYRGVPFPDRPDTALDGASATAHLESHGTPGQIGFEQYSAQIDLTMDSSYRNYARISGSFDLASNGFGLVAAGLSVMTTLREWRKIRYEESVFGRAANDPRVIVIAAFAEAYAATYQIAKARIGVTAAGASRSLAGELFPHSPRLVASAGFRGSALVEAAVASKTISRTARIAGGLGIVLSASLAIEGYNRGDRAMMLGNGIVAVAGVALLMFTGPIAIVAAVAIVIGTVVTAFSLDDVQRWVQDGFWGTSGDYWGKDRVPIQVQIEAARDIARSESANQGTIRDFYEAELQRYIEMNSTLEISALGNGRLLVKCAALQSAADMDRLSVMVKYDAPGMQFGYEQIAGIRQIFGGAGTAIVSVPAGNYDTSDGNFIVEGSMRSVAEGSLTEEVTLSEGELW